MSSRDIRESGRRDNPQRAKMVVVCAALVIALVLMGLSLRSAVGVRSRTRALDTPGWRMVSELNEKLNAQQAFVDTGFVVESERPLKLKVVGGVRTQRDLEALRAFVKELRPGEPEDSVAIEVEVGR